jgi:hypothetical protein
MKHYVTVSDRAKMKKSLTKDGERVLQVLQREYKMEREAAVRLMQDGGPMFAVALLTRRGMQ